MHLHIDVSWLLDVQEAALGDGEDMSVADYSALVAAVARHKTKLPTLEAADPDAAWRAAALMHTIVRLEPLPYRNGLYAAYVTAQYMSQSGEGIDPPYGTLSDLVRKIRDTRLRVPEVADQLRSWKI
ncbi:toxin Doc [Streptomyces phaeochromogenes]|uniref:toxin Doc n=1 Tax=Streptomyces phaeochromogenes TaxID=1923 RepID=UPI0033D72C76